MHSCTSTAAHPKPSIRASSVPVHGCARSSARQTSPLPRPRLGSRTCHVVPQMSPAVRSVTWVSINSKRSLIHAPPCFTCHVQSIAEETIPESHTLSKSKGEASSRWRPAEVLSSGLMHPCSLTCAAVPHVRKLIYAHTRASGPSPRPQASPTSSSGEIRRSRSTESSHGQSRSP